MATVNPVPPTLEEPLKIVSSENGTLILNEANLSTILQGFHRHPEFSKDIPVVAVSILGPEKSGKTFFTNLLIQYLKAGKEEGGWFKRLLTKQGWWFWNGNQPNLSGFLWDSITPSDETQPMFQPNEEDRKSTGIYLWPEPFVRKTFGEKAVIVLVFHLCRGQTETIEDEIALETFLLMGCTGMAEIYPVGTSDVVSPRLRLLDARKCFGETEENLCKNILYILRGVTHHKKDKDVTDIEELKLLMKSVDDEDDLSILRAFKELDIVRLEESSQPLHDENGRLHGDNPMLKRNANFTKTVTLILEEPDIEPDKLQNSDKICTDNFIEFIKSCVAKVNSLNDSAEFLPTERSTRIQPGENGQSDKSQNLHPPASVASLDSQKAEEQNNTATRVVGDQGNTPREIRENAIGNQFKPETNLVEDASCMGAGNKEQNNAVEVHKAMTAKQRQRQLVKKEIRDLIKQMSMKHQILEALEAEIQLLNDELQLISVPQKEDIPEYSSPYTAHQQAQPSTSDPNPDNLPPEPEPRTKNQACEYKSDTEEESFKSNESEGGDVEEIKTKTKDNEDEARGISARRPGDERKPDHSDHTADIHDKQIRAEEQERRGKQQKEEKMLEIIPIAVEQLKSLYKPAIANWMDIYLNQYNIANIENVHTQIMHAARAEFHHKIDQEFREEFDDTLDKEWGQKFKTFLKGIGRRLALLNSEMLKIITSENHLSQPKLEEIGKEKFREVLASQQIHNAELQKLLRTGWEKLMRIYSTQNETIYGMINQLVSFHKDEMAYFRKSGIVHSPVRLAEFQAKLDKICVDEFRNAFTHINQPGEVSIEFSPDKRLEELFELLRKEFFTHVKENNGKLTGFNGEFSKIMKMSKTSYVEKIEAVLGDNTGGLDENKLAEENEKVFDEVMESLSSEIHKTIRHNEPVDVHKQSLKAFADDYYPTVQDANSKNLQQKAAAPASETKQSISGADIKKPKSPTASKDNISEPHENSNPSNNSKKDTTPLPPIIFQLQSKRILMGMLDDGSTEILKNESGEEFTPLIVGLTQKRELSYGKQVEKGITELEKGSNSNLKSYWWISDYFAKEKTIWEETIRIGNDEHVIRIQFLLGFLLRKLKEHVEIDLKEGTCSTAIITVPYWFCSTQRVQVRESAQLAGFADVYLVNEASAAALACARSPDRLEPPNNILVFSETSGKVDATIYSYSANTEKVTMLGHCGSYNKDERAKGNLVQETILQLASKTSNAIGFLVGVVTNPFGSQVKSEDARVTMLRSICKGAIKHASDSNPGNSTIMAMSWEVFAISECETWKSVLAKVCVEKADKFCYMKEQYAAIFGAAICSKAPQDISQQISELAGFSISVFNLRGLECEGSYKCHVTPIAKAAIKIPFSSKKTIVDIYEMRDSSVILCRVTAKVSKYTEVLVHFRVDREGIVEWLSLGDTYGRNLDGDCNWTIPNLIPDEFARLQSLLDHVHGQQSSNESLKKAKKELLVKCNDMRSKLDGGEAYTIKSAVTKTLFSKRIDDAKSIANHPTATLEQIQEQMDALVAWNSKYQKLAMSKEMNEGIHSSTNV